MTRRPAPLAIRVIRSAVLVYLGLLAVLGGCQRRYIYYPARAPEPALRDRAGSRGLEPWRGEAGELIGWRTGPAAGAESAVLVFHGNAGHALHRSYYSDALSVTGPGRARETFLFEYPGYGAREGRPSERAIVSAARSAFARLRAEGAGRVFLLGESLGSGVACALAAEFPDEVAGLLLITPFSSLTDVARHHYPAFPVGLLLRDRYDNEAALRGYAGPVVIVVADRDAVVPASLGRRLYEGYGGPKRLRRDAGQTHNELWISPHAPWWMESWEFLDGSGAAPGPG